MTTLAWDESHVAPEPHSEEYRRGFADACGHYPGCTRRGMHTQGAWVCGACGARQAHGVGPPIWREAA